MRRRGAQERGGREREGEGHRREEDWENARKRIILETKRMEDKKWMSILKLKDGGFYGRMRPEETIKK